MFITRSRYSLLAKIAAGVLLIILADWLFPNNRMSSTVGVLAILWTVAAAIVRPAMRKGPPLIALGAALLLGGVLVYDPSLLAWTLFWCALSAAALLPGTAGFDDAYRWAARLALHALTTPAAALLDLRRLFGLRRAGQRTSVRSIAALLALPLAGGALFVALFATANPVIQQAIAWIELPSIPRILFWVMIAIAIWPMLRPRAAVIRLVARMADPEISLPGTSLPSVLIALGLFNALFAIQNGLDIAFLWSGAPLPPGTTAADYAHRGAYPLIVTALLAGLFVLTMLRPGTASAASVPARRLVVLWVAQNLLLVASSALRTIDYIAASELTRLRIAALAWMTLVAVGLSLICWRMLKRRSARWLINANALAAGFVLMLASIVDLGAVAAAWNVRHAREVGGDSGAIDLCYLHALGTPALVPLAELERRPLPAGLRDRVQAVRHAILVAAERYQSNWRDWTWRDSRRLAIAQALLGPAAPMPSALPAGASRDCGGGIVLPDPPPPAPPPMPVPLTKAPTR